jgi:hypothetical protein
VYSGSTLVFNDRGTSEEGNKDVVHGSKAWVSLRSGVV